MINVTRDSSELAAEVTMPWASFVEIHHSGNPHVAHQSYNNDQESHNVMMQVNDPVHQQCCWILEQERVAHRRIKMNRKWCQAQHLSSVLTSSLEDVWMTLHEAVRCFEELLCVICIRIVSWIATSLTTVHQVVVDYVEKEQCCNC